VAEFLTAEWVAELDAAAAVAAAPDGVRLVVQQVVLDVDGRELAAYAVRFADGRVQVVAGHAADADVSFTQDRDTAAAIARGELSAQAAFLAGRLRVGGDLAASLATSRELAGLIDVFAVPRAATAW
jgi:predicted lipid carrier protein YhbT